MGITESKERSFKERFNQIRDEFFAKIKAEGPITDPQDFNERIVGELFGEKLVDLLNEEFNKVTKVQEGLGTILNFIHDYEKVLEEPLKAVRATDSEDEVVDVNPVEPEAVPDDVEETPEG